MCSKTNKLLFISQKASSEIEGTCPEAWSEQLRQSILCFSSSLAPASKGQEAAAFHLSGWILEGI